jgi:hypothetical protein
MKQELFTNSTNLKLLELVKAPPGPLAQISPIYPPEATAPFKIILPNTIADVELDSESYPIRATEICALVEEWFNSQLERPYIFLTTFRSPNRKNLHRLFLGGPESSRRFACFNKLLSFDESCVDCQSLESSFAKKIWIQSEQIDFEVKMSGLLDRLRTLHPRKLAICIGITVLLGAPLRKKRIMRLLKEIGIRAVDLSISRRPDNLNYCDIRPALGLISITASTRAQLQTTLLRVLSVLFKHDCAEYIKPRVIEESKQTLEYMPWKTTFLLHLIPNVSLRLDIIREVAETMGWQVSETSMVGSIQMGYKDLGTAEIFEAHHVTLRARHNSSLKILSAKLMKLLEIAQSAAIADYDFTRQFIFKEGYDFNIIARSVSGSAVSLIAFSPRKQVLVLTRKIFRHSKQTRTQWKSVHYFSPKRTPVERFFEIVAGSPANRDEADIVRFMKEFSEGQRRRMTHVLLDSGTYIA